MDVESHSFTLRTSYLFSNNPCQLLEFRQKQVKSTLLITLNVIENFMQKFDFCYKSLQTLIKDRAAAVPGDNKDLESQSVDHGYPAQLKCLGLTLGCSQHGELWKDGGQ